MLHPAIYTAVPFPQVLPQIPTFYVASTDVIIRQILSAIHEVGDAGTTSGISAYRLTTKRSTVMVGDESRLKGKLAIQPQSLARVRVHPSFDFAPPKFRFLAPRI